jgi:hypothetical protein
MLELHPLDPSLLHPSASRQATIPSIESWNHTSDCLTDPVWMNRATGRTGMKLV